MSSSDINATNPLRRDRKPKTPNEKIKIATVA
jgi:hypothetical protein